MKIANDLMNLSVTDLTALGAILRTELGNEGFQAIIALLNAPEQKNMITVKVRPLIVDGHIQNPVSLIKAVRDAVPMDLLATKRLVHTEGGFEVEIPLAAWKTLHDECVRQGALVSRIK